MRAVGESSFGFRVYTGDMRDYLTTRRNKTGHIRLYTNVPRNNAAPSCNRVGITQGLLSGALLRIVVHPHNNSFLCAPLRVRHVRRSVHLYEGLNISNMIVKYLARSKRISVRTGHQLIRLTGNNSRLGPVDIAFRHTFSQTTGPRGTLRSVVSLNYSHVLASNRRPGTMRNMTLLSRLERTTTKHVVLLTKYNMGRSGVHAVFSTANVRRCRFSTEIGIPDGVGRLGAGICVNTRNTSRDGSPIASTREMGRAVTGLLK